MTGPYVPENTMEDRTHLPDGGASETSPAKRARLSVPGSSTAAPFQMGSMTTNRRSGKTALTSDPLEMFNFRKVSGAKCSDYFCSVISYISHRPFLNPRHSWTIPPHSTFSKDVYPAPCLTQNPMTAISTQWINTVYNYDARHRSTDPSGGINRKAQLSRLIWTRGGRRLIAATTQGDFILWNGHSYNIESRTIAHEDTSCRALTYAPINDLLLSGDDRGVVRIWQANLNCVRRVEAHPTGGSVIRDIALSPSEQKFVTCSKDGTSRIWCIDTCQMEARLEGHGSDVTCLSWHPRMALLATGSADRDIRLWDIRTSATANHVETLQSHTAGLSRVRFSPCRDEWLLSAGRDGRICLWDVRNPSEPCAVFLGHTKEVLGAAWHPHHSSLFTSCGADGTLAYWVIGFGDAVLRMEGKEIVNRWVAAVPKAHGEFRGQPTGILDAAWHPLGHVVATSSLDARLWARNKPGTETEVRYNDQLDIAYDMGTTAETARQLARAAATGVWQPEASKGTWTNGKGSNAPVNSYAQMTPISTTQSPAQQQNSNTGVGNSLFVSFG